MYSTTDFAGYYNSSERTPVTEQFKWNNEEIARLIQIIFRPILTIIGTIGNCLILYVMRRSSLKNVSTCFYMFLLALADTVVLWSGCFNTWIQILTHNKISPDTWTDCKLGYFLFCFGRQYSSMLLILMSLEKCFAVYFPLKSKTVCTVKTAKWYTGIVGVVLAGYNLQWFVVMESGITESSDYYICVKNEYYYTTLDILDSSFYSFGPFALMFLTNFAIVFKFIKAKCQKDLTESTNQALVKAATRGTAMVVTVSVAFILLTAPTAVSEALFGWWNPLRHSFPLLRAFAIFTHYLNHSINGLLYCIVGSRFREEVFRIFHRKRIPQSVSVSHSVNHTSLTDINESAS